MHTPECHLNQISVHAVLWSHFKTAIFVKNMLAMQGHLNDWFFKLTNKKKTFFLKNIKMAENFKW